MLIEILIVEDDAAMARGLAERLKLSGFAVDIESDGASVAETALLEPYSLVILDINLPNVSGFEVLHKIRKAASTVPIMILTDRYAIDDKVSGLDLGADDYLSKPFDISEFDARVRALVRRGQGLPNPKPVTINRRGMVTFNLLLPPANQVGETPEPLSIYPAVPFHWFFGLCSCGSSRQYEVRQRD